MKNREQIKQTRRWVVKIGSALLTDDGNGLDRERLAVWAEQMATWVLSGKQLILVSSGAVAEGMSRMGWDARPTTLHELQAAAAIGQMGLVQAYESAFKRHGLQTAQVLVTHDDLANRQRYLNARSTLRTLLGMEVIPVVNENDTVATDEIRFGDNDNLAALVANLVEAELLIILTDQRGMYDRDPRKHADAELLSEVRVSDPALRGMAGESGGTLGRGGMQTKLAAARRAARSGCATVIAPGSQAKVLAEIRSGIQVGTLLLPDIEPVVARKQWLAGHLQARGRLVLDDGAVRVLRESGRSLLPVGVAEVHGQFSRGELVICVDAAGEEVARGLVNYPAAETRQIMRRSSREIEGILGYVDEEELIHRDNLVLV